MKIKLLTLAIFLFLFDTTTAQTPDAQSLKQKLATATSDSVKVNALSGLAYAYVFTYLDSGENYAKQGLQLARKIGYRSGEAGCFGVLGLASNFSGDYANALNYGIQSLAIFSELRDTTMMIWSGIQVTTDYNSLEDYDQAFKYGHETNRLIGLKTSYSRMDSNQASVVSMALAYAHRMRRQADSALFFSKKAFAWDSSWYGGYQIVGEVYAALGRTDSALHYFQRGIQVAKRQDAVIFLSGLYNNVSKVYESVGQTDSAIFYANSAVHQAATQTITSEYFQASLQLARLYQVRINKDSTIKYLKLAHILKDSLYNRKKTREAQNFAFNEVLHRQEMVAQRQKETSRVRTAILLAVVVIFLLIAFFLWRNNRRKQKANALLENKNRQIENTLNQLRSAQAQLIQSEKMASLGELTAGIAHEIQNPLNFVNNFSEVSKELIEELRIEKSKGESEKDEELEDELLNDISQNLEKINHHGKRADAIVKGMLQHSRSSTGVRESTDINELTDECLRLAYHGLKAKDNSFNVKINTDFDKTVGPVNIIPQDMGRVILNLLTNAFYAVNEKKKNTAPGKDGNEYEPEVKVSTRKSSYPPDNRYRIEIKVSDNGNGIPQKLLEKIFQPFFTTKPTGQGTGLGLSLAYDIAKAHGGEIGVETKEGQGSVFSVFIPISNAD